MPHVDGMGLFQGILDRELDTDVIFLTGYGTIENAVECLRRGASDYLLKPFNFKKLLGTIDTVLDKRRQRPGTQDPGQLAALVALTSALACETDLSSIIKAFLGQVRETFQPDAMGLFMANSQGEGFKPGVFGGKLLKTSKGLRQVLSSAAEKAMRENSCKTIPVHDLGNNGNGNGSHPKEFNELSLLATPLFNADTCVGAVCLARGPQSPAFEQANITLFSLFASHAATAMSSASTSKRLSKLNIDIITSYVRAVEAKDVYTSGHSERVSAFAVLLGKKLRLPPNDLERLRVAGMLHDIGKIGIPDNVLNKPARLTAEEFEIMKRHPAVAEKILSRIEPLQEVLPIIYHHHEWFDGRGYPAGLRGEQIPRLSRIISVVDGFEAMTSDRAYHKAKNVGQALAVLADGAGTQWDPAIVQAWEELVAEHPTALRESIAGSVGYSAVVGFGG
jgi:HD-GYP domain-containing protein (c-di-GMP phosphodiesterase class II)/CheY-like chemotaxis protein